MLEDLLVITNCHNNLIYKFSSTKKDEKTKELLLLAFASLDIFKEIRQEQPQYFYFSIDKFLESKVSLLLLPSGYKIIFVNQWKDRTWISEFLKSIHQIFKKVSTWFNLRYFSTTLLKMTAK